MFTASEGVSILSTVLSSVATVIVSFGFTCYMSAMLPFITDQIIGATSDELSAVVRWFYWAQNVGFALTSSIISFAINNLQDINISSTIIFDIPLAVIIISVLFVSLTIRSLHSCGLFLINIGEGTASLGISVLPSVVEYLYDKLDGVSDLMSPVQPLLTKAVTDDDHSKRNAKNYS